MIRGRGAEVPATARSTTRPACDHDAKLWRPPLVVHLPAVGQMMAARRAVWRSFIFLPVKGISAAREGYALTYEFLPGERKI